MATPVRRRGTAAFPRRELTLPLLLMMWSMVAAVLLALTTNPALAVQYQIVYVPVTIVINGKTVVIRRPVVRPVTSRVALAVEVTGGGQVISEPAGVDCGSDCSENFTVGTKVTLTAVETSGVFGGWSGDCSGTEPACVVTMSAARRVSASFSSPPVGPAPMVLYTDVPSAPVSGGEGNQGGYLSIFGRNFGPAAGLGVNTRVFIGDAEVSNYRYLGPARVNARLGLQQLTVQVGPLGNPTHGRPLPIKVVVNGQASGTAQTFTPNPGRILFVALSGNDSTAVAGDISRPWRYLQNGSGGAYATMRAGDQIVIRGGKWGDTNGIDQTWLRFGNDATKKGSPPTGTANTGWIHLTAYPGPINGNAPETVRYTTPAARTGGIQGPWSAIRGVSGEYIAISNLQLEVSATANRDGAPVNLQYSAGPWRIVNNELGPWPSTLASPNNAKAGGVAGEGNGVEILGNYIHDIECARGQAFNPLENHGIYIDDDGRYDIAWNVFERIPGGNGLQIYTNGGFAEVTNNVSFHHNIVDGVGKHGINLADGSGSNITVFNNLVVNTNYAGMRINSIDLKGARVFNNTFYNVNTARNPALGAISNDWGLSSGSLEFVNNIVWPASGVDYLGGSTGFRGIEGSFANNLWFGGVWDGNSVPAFISAPVMANPQFNGLGTDWRLQAASPAIDRGTATVAPLVNDDLDSVHRPAARGYDIGAYERASSN